MNKFFQNFQAKHLPKSIPSFEDTGLPESYRAEYDANPWANQVATGGFLGIGQRQQQQQFDINARQTAFDLLNRAHTEEYESPIQATARQRLAGINSDLLGLENAGSAGENPSHLPFPEQDVQGQVNSVANMMLNIASIATGIPNFISDIQGRLLENRSQVIENILKMGELVDSDAGYLKPILDLPEDASAVNLISAAGKVFSRSEDLAKAFFPHDKQMRDLFTKQYVSRQNNLKNILSRYQHLADINTLQASPEINDVDLIRSLGRTYCLYEIESAKNKLWYEREIEKFNNAHPDAMQNELLKEHDAKISELDLQKASADYDKGVIDKLDPATEASAMTAERILQIYRDKQSLTDEKFLDEWESYFEGDPAGGRYKREILKKKVPNDSDMQLYIKRKALYKSAKQRVYGPSSRRRTRLSFKGVGLEF